MNDENKMKIAEKVEAALMALIGEDGQTARISPAELNELLVQLDIPDETIKAIHATLEARRARNTNSQLDFFRKRISSNPDANACLQEFVEAVQSMLTEQETDILNMRLGLYDGRIYTQEEVSQIFGVTRERICQIENKALRRVHLPSRAKKIKDFYC